MSEDRRPFGDYVLLKALGRGASADIFLARPYDESSGVPTPVVVKRLYGELGAKPNFIARFTHEARVAVNVDSSFVAKVYDAGSVGSTLYIVMEYVPGWPLEKLSEEISKRGMLPSIAAAVDAIGGALEGLAALHSAADPTGESLGIVHRDIAPKNLMVREDGQMCIIDLGLGKSTMQEWRTRTGTLMGSPGYMPPEQAMGAHVDARADVYAMGAIAFELLTMRNYIQRGSLNEMISASMSPKFRRPSELRPDIPTGLDEVIERALKPHAADRFQNAADFLAALRRVVPASHTTGGMYALVDALFAGAKLERKRELEKLLSLPLPFEDPQEFEPTEVFALRSGVHRRPKAEQTLVVRRRGAKVEQTLVDPAPRYEPADLAPSTRLTEPQPSTPRRSPAVSVGVLIASVVVAAVVAFAAGTRFNDPVTAPESVKPVDIHHEAPQPVVAQARQEELPAVESEPRTQEKTKSSPPTKRLDRGGETRVAAPRSIETQATSLKDEALALAALADDLISRLPEGAERQKAMRAKMDLNRDIKAGDERLRQSIENHRANLRALSGGSNKD